MNKGNPQFTSWTYEGDIAEATKWLPYAVGMLKSCAKRAVARHTETPSDAVLITVDATTGRVHIKVGGGLYMESGFLSFGTDKPGTQGQNDPAWLYYNNAVQSWMTTTNYSMQGKIKTTPVSGGEVILYGSNSKAVRANQYTKKFTQGSVPSSLFSGKMRLFVQALYGSKRDDYTYNGGMPSLYLSSSTPGTQKEFVLTPHYTENTWLITTANHDYFVVKYFVSFLAFFELVYTKDGQAIIDEIRTSPPADNEMLKKMEAYAFSTAKIGALHSMVDINTPVTGGEPLAHGWHVTWNGLKAQIVLLDVSSDNDSYNNTRYQLTINPQYNDGVYTFSVQNTIVEGPSMAFVIINEITVIYPDYMKGGMYAWPQPSSVVSYQAQQTDMNATFYVTCEDDAFKPIGIHQNYTSLPVGSNYNFQVIANNRKGSEYEYEQREIYYNSSKGSSVRDLSVTGVTNTACQIYGSNITDVSYERWDRAEGVSTSLYGPIVSNLPESWTAAGGGSDYDSGLGLRQYMQSVGKTAGSAVPGKPGFVWGAILTFVYQTNQKINYRNGSLSRSGGVFIESVAYDCESVVHGSRNSYYMDLDQNVLRQANTGSGWGINLYNWAICHVRSSNPSDYSVIEERDALLNVPSDLSLISSSNKFNQSINNFDIKYSSSGNKKGSVVSGNTYNSNFHFSANWFLNESIGYDHWRSNSTGEYFVFDFDFGAGGNIKIQNDWTGDSVVGWV